MKEVKYSLLYVILFQILCWGIFMLCYEFPLIHRSNAESIASIVGIILILIISIIYFLFNKKIIIKHHLNPLKFNVLLMLFWLFFSIIITLISIKLIDLNIIHSCYSNEDDTWLKCFLNGIECLIFGIELIFQTIILVMINIVKLIIKKLIKKS